MKTVGVILARLQPIHNGHLALIQKSVNEKKLVDLQNKLKENLSMSKMVFKNFSYIT